MWSHRSPAVGLGCFALCFIAVCSGGTIPADWKAAEQAGDLLFAGSLDSVDGRLFPNVGNGYLGTVVGSQDLFLSGVFVNEVQWLSGLCISSGWDNYTLSGPCRRIRDFIQHNHLDPFDHNIGSRRARIPAPHRVAGVLGLDEVGMALDMRAAVVRRRFGAGGDGGGGVVGDAVGPGVELRWFAHRRLRSLLVFEVDVDNRRGKAAAHVELDQAPVDPSADISFAAQPLNVTGATAVVGRLREGETPSAELVEVAMVSAVVPAALDVPAGVRRTYTFVAAVRSSLDSPAASQHGAAGCANALQCATADYEAAVRDGGAGLLASHQTAWEQMLNEGGVDITPVVGAGAGAGAGSLAAQVNSTMYYILSSYRPDWPYAISPGGVQTTHYWGLAFWDSTTDIVPGIFAFHPDAVRAEAAYRVARIQGARDNAAQHGFKGCMVPWQQGATGHEVDIVPMNKFEQHMGGDLCLLFERFFMLSNDTAWLKFVLPLVTCVAEFYAARAELGNDGRYHIHGVVPPDEFAVGLVYEGVTDSVWTNYVAQRTLRFAALAAERAISSRSGSGGGSGGGGGGGGDAANALQRQLQHWRSVADGLVILYDNATDTHPEYQGFPHRNVWSKGVVKQADAILLNFPGNMPMAPSTVVNDLLRYEQLYDPNGPAMTASVSAVGWLQVGNASKADELFARSGRNMQSPFNVWTETPNPKVHPSDMGAYNFLTAGGAWLQSLVHGYAGLRITDDHLHFSPAHLPPNAAALRLRSIHYQSCRFSLEYDARTVRVWQLHDDALACTELFVREDGQGSSTHRLVPGAAPTQLALGGLRVSRNEM